jgi:hypothetical protein
MIVGFFSLLACSGGVVVIGDTGSVATASDSGLATDTGTETNPGDTGGTQDTVDTEDTTPPEPVPDTSVWNSELIFNYDTWGEDGDCVDELVTEISSVPSNDELAALSAECPACTAFYRTYPSTTVICNWIDIPESELRGLVLGDDWAQVYSFSGSVQDGFVGEVVDSAATYDGWTVTFSAVFEVWWVDLFLDGTITFPETFPQG